MTGRGTPDHQAVLTAAFFAQLTIAFIAYFIAGKLGQATTNIRSSNLGPVWPAYGIALASFLAWGYRVWPGILVSAFLVAWGSSVPAFAALGQAIGATIAATTGAFLLRRIDHFDPLLSRLRDALGLILVGAFGSAIISASIGIASLYSAGVQPYSGLGAAWLIYWLGDSTGVLLVTPLVFTLPTLIRMGSRTRPIELLALLTLLVATCVMVFGDLTLISIRLNTLAFGVLPFVMWAAINFGVGGASASVLIIATISTLLTAFGSGPFAGGTPFTNAVLLDVFFAVLAVSGLTLAAVIVERESAESHRASLLREQTALEARLRLAAIVESSDDAIVSLDLDGFILSWNRAAQRIFGFSEAEAVGQQVTMLIPHELRDEETRIRQRVLEGVGVEHHETIRVTKTGKRINVSLTVSPLKDAAGRLLGSAKIIRDVTEHKRAQEALSSVSRRLIEAQEKERTRIARELHDNIGQRLAMLMVEATSPADGQRLHGGKSELQRQISELVTDVQALSHELHSSKLELLGIAAAMNGFCREFADQQKVDVEFLVYDLPGELSSEVSLCLFRVLQEALHNSAKHSGDRKFEVQLRGSPREVHLVVKDHGTGFDVVSAAKGRGLGLVSMKERLNLVNGDLSIVSLPSRGTTVHARVPFTPPNVLRDS